MSVTRMHSNPLPGEQRDCPRSPGGILWARTPALRAPTQVRRVRSRPRVSRFPSSERFLDSGGQPRTPTVTGQTVVRTVVRVSPVSPTSVSPTWSSRARANPAGLRPGQSHLPPMRRRPDPAPRPDPAARLLPPRQQPTRHHERPSATSARIPGHGVKSATTTPNLRCPRGLIGGEGARREGLTWHRACRGGLNPKVSGALRRPRAARRSPSRARSGSLTRRRRRARGAPC